MDFIQSVGENGAPIFFRVLFGDDGRGRSILDQRGVYLSVVFSSVAQLESESERRYLYNPFAARRFYLWEMPMSSLLNGPLVPNGLYLQGRWKMSHRSVFTNFFEVYK